MMSKAGYAGGMYTGPQVTMVVRQLAARLEHRAGRRRRPGQDRLQGEDDLGHALDDVHEVLQRAEERAEHLPERRLAAGLPRAADHPRRHVRRRNSDHAGQQLELAAPERPEDQRGDRTREDAHRRPRPAGPRGARSTTRSRRPPAAVPWIWENFPSLYSKRVTPASELWNGGSPDVTFMSVSGS